MTFISLGSNVYADIITTDANPVIAIQTDLSLPELTNYGFGPVSNYQKWNVSILGTLEDGYSDGYGGSVVSARFEFTTKYDLDTNTGSLMEDEPLIPEYICEVVGDALDWVITIHIVGIYLLIQVQGDDGEPVSWSINGTRSASFADLEA